MNALNSQVRITEIFHSLQGESTKVGLPTVFIRLTGCPLRCHYCDTPYAFKGGKTISFAAILSQLKSYECQDICVSGGEPLAQPRTLELLTLLCNEGYRVSLETSGAFNIEKVDPRVLIVMDIKTPASGESSKNLWSNLDFLKPTDQIKFVICDQQDYCWAREQITLYQLATKAQLLFSPSWEQLPPRQLADWIIADRLPVRFQLQLHKILWGDEPGH